MTQFSETSVADGLVSRCVNPVAESDFSHTLGELKKRMQQQTIIFLGDENPTSHSPEDDAQTSFEKPLITTLPDVNGVPSVLTLFDRATTKAPVSETQSNGTAQAEEPPPPFERSKTIIVIPTVTRQKTFICENAEVRANNCPPPNLASKRSINTTGLSEEVQTRKVPSQVTRGPRVPKQRARWVRPPSTAICEAPRRTSEATVAPVTTPPVQQKSIPKQRITTPPVQQKSIPKQRISTPMSRQGTNKACATPYAFVSRPVTPAPVVTTTLNSPRTPRQVPVPPPATTPPPPLPDIPERALRLILSYLPSLASVRAAQVCRRWRAASVSTVAAAMCNLRLDPDGSTAVNVRLLGHARCAGQLSITGRSDTERLLRAVTAHKLKLQSITITNCSSGWAEPLIIILRGKNLKSIQVRNSGRPAAANVFWERLAQHFDAIHDFELPGNATDASVMCSQLLRTTSSQRQPVITALHVQWESSGSGDIVNEVAGVVRWKRNPDSATLMAGRLSAQIVLAAI